MILDPQTNMPVRPANEYWVVSIPRSGDYRRYYVALRRKRPLLWPKELGRQEILRTDGYSISSPLDLTAELILDAAEAVLVAIAFDETIKRRSAEATAKFVGRYPPKKLENN